MNQPNKQLEALLTCNLTTWCLVELNSQELQTYGCASNDSKDRVLAIFFACTTVFFIGLSGYLYWKPKGQAVHQHGQQPVYSANQDLQAQDVSKKLQGPSSHVDPNSNWIQESQPTKISMLEPTDLTGLSAGSRFSSPFISNPDKWVDREHMPKVTSKNDENTWEVPKQLPCHADFVFSYSEERFTKKGQPYEAIHHYSVPDGSGGITIQIPDLLIQQWLSGEKNTSEFEKIVFLNAKEWRYGHSFPPLTKHYDS